MARTKIDASLVPTALQLTYYRRPTLVWNSITSVGIERGFSSPAASATTVAAILFPDGQFRTDSSTNRIDFDITRNAVFNGSNQSGLRSGQSESVNTWYAMYAVKCQNNTTDFVLVGDGNPASRGNVTALNTAYGTNGWVYLGYIRNGDNSGATGDILRFSQTGCDFVFSNVETDIAGNGGVGLRLAAGAVTSLTYTIAPGMGVGNGGSAVDIPGSLVNSNLKFWVASGGPAAASEFVFRNSANTQRYFDVSLSTGNRGVQTVQVAMYTQNVVATGTTTGSGLDINLYGWSDAALTANWSAEGGN